MATKTLRGASTWRAYHLGPCVAAGSYPAVEYGPTDVIEAGAGEVAARVVMGSPTSLAHWIVGPIDEVLRELRGCGLEDLAATIRRAEVA
jgi:hypothetical protein